MKRNIMSIGVILAAIFTLSACVEDLDNVQVDDAAGVQFEVSAGIVDTKTANDGLKTSWVAGDAISVFHAEADASAYVSDASFTVAEGDLEAGTFKGTLASALDASKSYDWYAVYPYVADSSSPKAAKVTVGNVAQTGDNTTAHHAGVNFPMWGVDSSVEAAARPTLAMTHLSSILEVVVTNSSTAEVTVNTVAFTAPEEVAGEFTVDLISENPAFTAVQDKSSKSSTLDVTGAAALTTGGSAKYYLSVKPFTAAAGSELVVSVNGIERKVTVASDVVFAPGHIRTLNFDYDQVAAPVVTTDKVAFSSATLNWTTDGLAPAFNIYVGGEKKATVNGDVLTYDLTGLPTGAESKVTVEAVGDHNTAMSDEVAVRTLGVRWIDAATRSVTIEWDETVEWPEAYTGGSIDASGKNGRGYQIAIYKDKDCAQEVYAVYTYWGSRYSFGNSSWYGKTGNCNYFVPTMLSMGYLEPNTTYYVRVRSVDDVTVGGMTLNNEAGTSEWSEPLEVKTEQSHVAEAGEVIFADFDELCFLTDRTHGCPGVIKDGDAYYVTSVGDSPNKDLNVYGVATAGTGTAGEYFSGSTFCAIGDPASRTYTNYIGNEGTALEGWHFSTNIRANMGVLTIDRARNRFFGTPALTGNLTDEEKPCVLTFDFGAFRTGANSSYSMNVQRLREGSLETVAVLEFTGQYTTDSPTSTDYKIDYCLSEKKVELSLKSGDAVIISAKDASNPFFMVYDNFKIVTK